MGVYDDKLRDFLTHLQLERGASPHTVEAYRRDLIDLGDFVEHSDPDTIPVSVLDDYAVALRDRGLSAATVRRRMAAVRAFFKHRAREGGRADAGRTVPLPRLGRSLPDPLTKAEAEAIVTRPDTSPLGLRDRAVLELLYGAGLRVSELASLRGDLDLAEGVVRCRARARQRIVPMGKSATEAARIYLQRGRPYLGRQQRGASCFLNAARPPHLPPGRVPARARPRAATPASSSPSRRTSCATRSRRTCSSAAPTCASCRSCSATRRVATTEIYTHLGDGALREAFERAHPRAAARPGG